MQFNTPTLFTCKDLNVRIPLLFLIIFLAGCTSSTTPSNDEMADAPLSITWEVISNIDDPDSFSSEMVITNVSDDTLTAEGWSLYFNFIRLLESHTQIDQIEITHINGDFYKLSPVTSFSGLAPEESLTISMKASAWAIKNSDAPSGFYMIVSNEENQDDIIPITNYTVRPFTTLAQTSRMQSDKLPVPTAASTYENNLKLTRLPSQEVPRIIPSPLEVSSLEGSFTVTQHTPVYYQEGLEAQANQLAALLSPVLDADLQISPLDQAAEPGIILRKEAIPIQQANEEAYALSVTPEGVVISGNDDKGVFYGTQTLRALIPPEYFSAPSASITLPATRVLDQPRFAYRGMHLDVSRNFQTVETVKRLLDAMAFYKLNKFHFHVTDDEGWRLEIPGLPELTEVGGRRGHTEDELDHLIPTLGSGPFVDELPGSGYYTREEYIDILRYAKALHIEVIPEIDVPGHARAAIVSMKARHHRLSSQGREEEANAFLLSHPEDTSTYRSVQHFNDNVIDVCLPSTYTFLKKVFDEVRLMHEDAGTPLKVMHTGGDEVPHGVWEGSPACNVVNSDNLHDYFLENMHHLLAKHDIRLAGWEEIALTEIPGSPKAPNPVFVPYKFQAYVWNNVWGWGMEDMAYKLANTGYPVVLSNATNLYFDLSYDKSPEEPGYYWASFVDTYKAYTMTPLDIFKSVKETSFGHPVDRHSAYPNRVRLTEAGRQNILGLQGQLWSERAYDAETVEYLVFPKLLGLAERAWAPQPAWAQIDDDAIRDARLAQSWNQFANQLGQRELHRLDGLSGGLSYRIPPPGARIEQGALYANTGFPGLEIRYTLDGTEPTSTSPLYTEPVEVSTTIRLRAFSPGGRHSRTVVLDAPL